MKIHNDFTLYWRVVPSGKRVVYYHAYDDNGKRLYGKSTGEITITAARLRCNRLLKEGKLVPNNCHMLTFAEYAKGWWEWDTCEYLKHRRKRVNLTEGYAVKSKQILNNHLLPYFGNIRLDKITPEVIEKWFDSVTRKKTQNTAENTTENSGDGNEAAETGSKKIKNTTINGYYSTLLTMLKWAVKKRMILSDPTLEIQKLVNDEKEIKIITRDEFDALFNRDWELVWGNDRFICTANKLAALTGMRISEILGLRGEYVFEDHIYICAQYDKWGYRPTKTKDTHNLPLVAEMIADLKELIKVNGQGFIFSLNSGESPVSHSVMYKGLHRALKNIGMDKAEIRKRNLALHGWRHFCNTEMLMGGLTVKQVQAITGHKSERMTDRYLHFDPTEFTKAREVQASLLHHSKPADEGRAKTAPGGADAAMLRLVKKTELKPAADDRMGAVSSMDGSIPVETPELKHA